MLAEVNKQQRSEELKHKKEFIKTEGKEGSGLDRKIVE